MAEYQRLRENGQIKCKLSCRIQFEEIFRQIKFAVFNFTNFSVKSNANEVAGFIFTKFSVKSDANQVAVFTVWKSTLKRYHFQIFRQVAQQKIANFSFYKCIVFYP